MSSAAESVFALEDPSPNRIAFDLERVMRTKYMIDDFQQTYFVISSFQDLLNECYRDFGALYERLARASDIEPNAVVPGDEVISRGTFGYFRAKNA